MIMRLFRKLFEHILSEFSFVMCLPCFWVKKMDLLVSDITEIYKKHGVYLYAKSLLTTRIFVVS